jgi:sugar lactone lactonase YvrE
MKFRQSRIMGGKGGRPDQFAQTLRAIAIAGRSEMYAVGDCEIKVFDFEGRLLRRWPAARPPLSVALSEDGSVHVSEIGQIEIFDTRGKLIRTWRDEKLLRRITAIGFADDSLLAGDTADRAIRRFDRQGRFQNNIGKDNPLNGLHIPNGVISFGVDAHGIVHAANPGKHRVERYTPDGKLLGHIGRFDGIDPAGFPGCCNPTNVAVGDAIYVTEKAGPRVKAYDFEGNLLAVIAGPEFDPNCKNMSIAVDGAHGRVAVADTVKLAIFVFERVNA